MIKDYLSAMKLMEGHLADTVKILKQLIAQLTEALLAQEAERSRQNRAMADRMDRLDVKLDRILDLLGEPMSNPDAG